MPLARYEIRNEYRLSDPEVYRAADKDDPEALLEGVAMAGLIGVLRQLGDLADFAAVIFHDLHEEVMATAARGHGLMVRVQQLEMEFPSIEKAFLSQTSHMHFAHSAGLDYHSSVRMDQNLVTQGDLPRFVMDSYEECRGPPRLFLLDKFDVAGAGACLKRYSDPSSFKMELSSSETRKSDEAHREKRARKSKKKGLRLRNGEAPDILSASHGSSKLYHLFATSDEQNQIPTNTPTHDLKLKPRQFIGSPFSNSRTRKSYMEPVLEIQLPECSVKTGNMKSNDDEIEMGIENSSIMLLIEERIHISSPDRQREAAGSPCDLNNNVIEEKNVVSISMPISEFIEENIPSTYSHMDLKDVLVDGESKMEGSANGDVSDDMASELENYMDALTTMESEIETDSEYRSKHETRFNVEHQRMDSDKNEEQQELPIHSSDSLSIANSVASCDWNGLSRKGRSSFSNSDALSNCADLQPSQVTETTSTDLPANPQLLGLDDAVSSSVFDNPCFESVENASSLDNKILPAENVDINSETVLKNNRVLRAKSPEFLDLYESSSTSNSICLRSNMPDHELGRSHSTESFPYCLEDSKDEEETPHNCAESRKTEVGSLCCLEVSESEDEISPSCLEVSKSEKEISSSHVGVSKADPETSSSSEEACKYEKEISPGFAEVMNHQKETSSPAETDEEAFPVNEEGSKVEEATSRIEEVSNHSGSDLPNIPDLPSGTNDATALENLVPGEYCKDGSAVENSQSNTLSSPCSVVISPELHFQGLFEQNPDCFPDVENFIHPDEKSEDLSSIVDLQQINDFSEYEITIPTSGMQLVELEHFSEADISSNAHWHNSGMMDFAESAVGSPRTGAKLLSNNLEVLPNSQLEASSTDNDFPEAPIDDIKFTEESLSSSAAPSQQELKVLEDHLDRNGERITSEEDILENTWGPCINEPTVNTNDSEPSNPDPAELPSSEFLAIVHPAPHTEHAHLPLLSNDEDSRESDQYSEFKALSTDNLSGVGNPLEASMVESRKESGALSLPQGGQSCESSGLHFERLQVSEAMDTTHFSNDANINGLFNSSPVDLFGQQSETKIEPHSNANMLGNKFIVYEESVSSPAIEPEVAMLSSQGSDTNSLESLNVTKLSPFVSDKNESSVPLQLLEFSLPHSSAVDAGMEEMPPLPPLPPLQWRVGKSRPLFFMGEAEPPNSLDVSPSTEDEHNCQGGEVAMPPNLSYTLPTVEFEQTNGNLPSKHKDNLVEPPNLLTTENDEHNSLEGEMIEPMIGDLPSKHNDPVVDPPNLLTTGNDEQNSLEGEMMGPTNGYLPSKHKDALVDPPNLLTAENDEQNSLEGEMMEPSKLSVISPTVEDDGLNDVLPSQQSRPKNPLIEALASHDKSTLRRASDRVRFKSRPKMDEREVLLEQIRAKSFSLKPTVSMMKPSIQGPATNFKVAAILEKAKAIRQAFAGSDEDDGDNWSDA